jgi:hypothetical protein
VLPRKYIVQCTAVNLDLNLVTCHVYRCSTSTSTVPNVIRGYLGTGTRVGIQNLAHVPVLLNLVLLAPFRGLGRRAGGSISNFEILSCSRVLFFRNRRVYYSQRDISRVLFFRNRRVYYSQRELTMELTSGRHIQLFFRNRRVYMLLFTTRIYFFQE